jgi:hypothetical protein
LADPVPGYITEPLLAFLRERKSGTLTLDIRDGAILSGKLTEVLRRTESAVHSS